MENSISPQSVLERIGKWFSESIVIKLLTIGFLMLILLIPQAWIQSLIYERESRANSVVDEVTSKWSQSQTLVGPVLVIPFTNRERIDRGKQGIEIREWTQDAFFLPENLAINGAVDPKILHRGIFDAAVYTSHIDVKTVFQRPDFKKLNVGEKDVHWNEARLVFSITDLRGISENPVFKMGDTLLGSEPSNQITFGARSSEQNSDDYSAASTRNGIVVPLPWKHAGDFSATISTNLELKGSHYLYFVPIGKTTDVTLQGPWADPSFDGNFLPINREVTPKGFSATWKVLHYNRPLAQSWTGEAQDLSTAAFGASLLIPVDQYQKSERTAKYGILIILLTFVSLFLVEIIRKIRIHAFQYLLIGAALVLYYTLLLAISEHVPYNVAYVIATLATVALISLYAITFLRRAGLVLFFSAVLLGSYGFIFVIIQLQDYSLLLGSVGLFFVLALVMYFSRNIQWHGSNDALPAAPGKTA